MSNNVESPPRRAGSVLRNTIVLVGAQALGIPLSIFLFAVLGRELGPADFGLLNLATNLCTFGFMFVEWGHGGLLPREIAKDHHRSGALLGSSLVSRLGLSLVVCALLAGLSLLIYPLAFLPVLGLIALQSLFGSIGSAYQDAARGYERTDVTAVGRLGVQVASLLVVVPVAMMGGSLLLVAAAIAFAGFVALPLVTTWTHRIGVGRPRFDRRELDFLTRNGWAFLASSVAMTSLGFVDSISLSKLATPEVFGWNAAALKLVGTLLIPSTALIASLYPTLSRLIVEDMNQYRITLRRSISGTGLVAIPLALGCALYSDLGIAIYGKEGYAPAGQNLIVLSAMVLLVYFSMPLGTALLAAGKQVAWATAQAACVVMRLVLNPILIPWFQEHFGNGGLGVCVSTVVCELVMVAVILYMIPHGVVTRELGKTLGKGLLAGTAMATVWWVMHPVVSPWISAPVSVTVYFGVLYAQGGVDTSQIARVTDSFRNKLGRTRQP